MKFDITKSYEPKPFLDWFNLKHKEQTTFEQSNAVIVPFGYEGTVTFGHGTDKGPEALIEASHQVETFDDEILDDIQNHIKIWTTQQPDLPKDPMEACKLLKEIALTILRKNKLPVVIGGEHSISYGFAQALIEHYKSCSVLVFDSHLDLGDQYSGKDFTHAAWLKYSLEHGLNSATLLGIRNYNKMEWDYWKQHMAKITVFEADEKQAWTISSIIDSIQEPNVYISFDIDAFDSSVMPATGTPEPGGLFWYEVLPIIKAVAQRKNIIGMDVVELAPIPNMHAPNFVAAKLLMKMILYAFKSKKYEPQII